MIALLSCKESWQLRKPIQFLFKLTKRHAWPYIWSDTAVGKTSLVNSRIGKTDNFKSKNLKMLPGTRKIYISLTIITWQYSVIQQFSFKKNEMCFNNCNHFFTFKGLLGWYMVKSGLDEEIVSKTEIPRVSQYRLASHLGLAFIAYAGMFWSGLGQLLPRSQVCNEHRLCNVLHVWCYQKLCMQRHN